MAIKKKLTILLVVVLSICLFFAFGFQIDVGGFISKEGGNADVSLIEPLRVAADESNAALAAAEQAVLDAQKALAAAEQAVLDAQDTVIAAQEKVDDTKALLVTLVPGTPEEISAAAQLIADEAALAAAEQAVLDAPTAVIAAQLVLEEAQAALAAAQLAVDEANAAYSGLKVKDDEELEALQLAAEKAQAALDEAMASGAITEVIDGLQQTADAANAALEEFEPDENGIMYSHIIINSNNGGSFTGDNSEGNYSGVDGDTLPFTFESENGFDLLWLRIGNIKIEATEDILPYLESFNKKNLTVHAHFKKDKDYDPEVIVEETGLEEDAEQGDENDDEKGNGKGKDKEKSNNGKKNK